MITMMIWMILVLIVTKINYKNGNSSKVQSIVKTINLDYAII